jgi:hypothetical protein
MGEIALVIPNNIWICPYVSIYSRILDEEGIKYDTISWNRDGREEIGIQYNCQEKSRNFFSVFLSYVKYSRFVKKTIKEKRYKKLIIFTPQVGLFLAPFLKKHFQGKFIFDYRDLSIEQKPIFLKHLRRLLSCSFANVISSPGFKKYLPEGYDYLISHNFNVGMAKDSLYGSYEPINVDALSVLTIGAIRTDSNYEVIDALGNQEGIKLNFVGKGIAAPVLEQYAKEKGYRNITFTGFYKKEEEKDIYEKNTFVNIVYPLIPSHISALSNRFYNSLIFRRPMIVTRKTVQGDYAEKYGVGLVINDCTDLPYQLRRYIKELDVDNYQNNCRNLLSVLLEENSKFDEVVRKFIKS